MRGKETLVQVVVTGGAGFVGANLCRALLDEEHESDEYWQ